ncbi:MAG: hypothetical protein JWP57_4401 [Spirosoma sp.]|nr:hypothetical protein [Spirosoma sp.]
MFALLTGWPARLAALFAAAAALLGTVLAALAGARRQGQETERAAELRKADAEKGTAADASDKVAALPDGDALRQLRADWTASK